MLKDSSNNGISAEDFLRRLEAMGIKLWLDNDLLRYKAPKGVVTKELLGEISSRKTQITQSLKMRKEKEILFAPIPQAGKMEYYPLSATQKRMFVLNQLDGESTAYNTTLALKIQGNLDKSRLGDVLKEIAARHESLRTTFEMINGTPVQKIHDKADFIIGSESIDGEDKIEGVIKDFVRPYDLSKLPLFRAKLVEVNANGGESTYLLLFDIHHIISDGVSAAVIIKEINALYAGEKLPELKVQYKDYCAWHKKLLSSGFIKKQKEFWAEQMSGEIPVLNLPLDYKRPVQFNPEGESLHLQVERSLTDRLKLFARENKTTLFTVLLSAYYLLLEKYTGQDDIIIGTPVAGRVHEDTSGMVGVFLNTLPLRNYPSPEKTIAGFIKETGRNCMRAFDNQDYPFDRLVEDLEIKRDPGRNPLFSTMFVMQNMKTDEIKGRGIRTSRYEIKQKMAQFDITVNSQENKDGLDFEFNYCTNLLRNDTVERFAGHFKNILRYITENPDDKISSLDMMSEDEKELILKKFSSSGIGYDGGVTLHGLFEKQAASTPDGTAVVFGGEKMSYDTLNKKASALAEFLRGKGAGAGKIIGLYLDPSFEMIIGILGILKSGSAYLPINTSLPRERIEYMARDSKCGVIISTSGGIDALSGIAEVVDAGNPRIYEISGWQAGYKCRPDEPAYVIYTSGTTGRPKGVMVSHGAISRTLSWRAEEYKFTARDRSLQLFSYSFDGFITSFFTPLISGAATVLLKKNMEKDPDEIKKKIIKEKITTFISVPVLYSAVLDCAGENELDCLKVVTLAGDKASPSLIEKSAQKAPRAELVNEYGPTESAVVATIHRGMTADTNTVIGKPAGDTEIYILNSAGRPQPVGVPGEICVSGGRLAIGYVGKPELTKEKFTPNPFHAGEKMYHTGDIGRWLPDGNIEFAGRADFQVKIRGYRIETSEIEAEIQKYEAVKSAVVIDRADRQGNKYLCAYIVPARDFTVMNLRNFLAAFLPDYMIPARFVKLENIPLSANGKIDRKALPEPEGSAEAEPGCVKPSGEIEGKIAAAWGKILGTGDIGADLNFFEIGGDSMSVINLHAEIENIYPGAITVTDLFSYPTIAKQAEYIKSRVNPAEKQAAAAATVLPDSGAESGNGDIAVIGMSVYMPGADTPEELWNIFKNGEDCIRDFPAARKKDAAAILRAQKHGTENLKFEDMAYLDEIDKFDCGFFGISPKEAELMDPNQRIFLQTAWNAAEDAGYGGKKLTGTRTGVYVGFAGESDYGRVIADLSPDSFAVAAPGNITSCIAGRVSYVMNLKGPSILVNAACASSLAAVHYACRGIKNGECSMAIAGGIKTWLYSLDNEYRMGIESKASMTKTFDDASDGTARGEGAAAILLKPLGAAIEDKDSIYAVIKGGYVNQDGASNGLTAPNPAAQTDVIQKAWRDAGINPETVSYIEAHGTGTKLGDPIEIDGIKKAFAKYTSKKQFCAIGSLKSNMGHLDNAAGIAGAVKAALSLYHREIPATLHFTVPNRAIDFVGSPVYVNNKTMKWENGDSPRRCGVSAFGMCGTNCHIIMEEAPERIPLPETGNSGALNVLSVSAKAKKSLLDLIGIYIDRYSGGLSRRETENLCYTLNTGRGQYEYRAAVIIGAGDNLPDRLLDLKRCVGGEDAESGVFYAESGNNSVRGAREYRDGAFERKAEEFVKSGGNDFTALSEICEMYVGGAEIEWEKLYSGEKPERVHAPAYPFLKRRCWLNLPDAQEIPENLYYKINWHKCGIAEGTGKDPLGRVLIISSGQDVFSELADMLENESKDIIRAVRGEKFSRTGENSYTFGGSREDFSLLLTKTGMPIDTVVYALPEPPREINSLSQLLEVQDAGACTFLAFVQALGSAAESKTDLVLVAQCVNEVTGGEEKLSPESAVAFGIGKCVGSEYGNINCRTVDIDGNTGARAIFNEIKYGGDYAAAYRGGARYTDVMERAEIRREDSVRLSEKGIYIITGATGRLGLEAAKFLAGKSKINIALLGRTPVPDRNLWDGILARGEKGKVYSVVRAVREIESSGSKVCCMSCDISCETQLEKTLSGLRKKYGRINGVIHCAAVAVGSVGSLIGQESRGSFEDILSPKVSGTWLLDKLTRVDRPDFFVMYSSGITVIGGFCSCAYTAANSYLDAYAAARSRVGLRTVAVDWPVWENESLKDKISDGDLMFKVLPMDEGLNCLWELINSGCSRTIVGSMNFASKILSLQGKLPFRLSAELNAKSGAIPAVKHSATNTAADSGFSGYTGSTEEIIAQIFAESLGYEQFSTNDNFFSAGGNSLIAVEAISKLGRTFHKNITLQCFYENPTAAKLARIFSGDDEKTDDAGQDEFEEIEL